MRVPHPLRAHISGNYMGYEFKHAGSCSRSEDEPALLLYSIGVGMWEMASSNTSLQLWWKHKNESKLVFRSIWSSGMIFQSRFCIFEDIWKEPHFFTYEPNQSSWTAEKLGNVSYCIGWNTAKIYKNHSNQNIFETPQNGLQDVSGDLV